MHRSQKTRILFEVDKACSWCRGLGVSGGMVTGIEACREEMTRWIKASRNGSGSYSLRAGRREKEGERPLTIADKATLESKPTGKRDLGHFEARW